MKSLTAAQVADRLGVSRTRVTQMIEAGDLRLTLDTPRLRLISPASLARLIEHRATLGIEPGKAGARGRPKKIENPN